MLRPTPGDPWGVEQHHCNTGAKENQQLNPGGPSTGDPEVPGSNPSLFMFSFFLASCINTEIYIFEYVVFELFTFLTQIVRYIRFVTVFFFFFLFFLKE